MEKSPHLLVYKASAGSGKTFTLAVQYILQLIEDPLAYRRILAVTFTNKATTEMKERILSQLYGIALNDTASEGYLSVIRKITGKKDTEIRQAARQALNNIIHDYSRFRIETIDSFFQSVMRNLARELELGANLSIELNNKDVLSDAVDLMLEKLDRNSPVLQWLLEYAEERIAEDKRWNMAGEIKGFGMNIFNETYLEQGELLREKLKDPKFITNYRKELSNLREEALDQIKGFSTHFREVLEKHGLSPEDLKNGSRGIGSYFRKLETGSLGDDLVNKTTSDCLAAAENWASRTSPNKETIISLAETELIDILKAAEQMRPKTKLLVNSCDLSLKYLNNLRLLSYIDLEVHEQNNIHNRFLLSDTNALLHRLIHEGDASFIYEKIGTTIDRVMIDEFQDTSRLQWENFHLLLEECLAQKDGSLIVGDIKQSIYRWRGGDWKILAGLEEDPAFRVKTIQLETNWRSEARIISFNNNLFETACRILDERMAEEKDGNDTNAAAPLVNAYSDVSQLCNKKEENGYVRLSFIQDSKDLPYSDTLLQQMTEEVERLIQTGININDIAILVRKKKVIPEIADYFDKHTPYRIVSDEAFRLDASLAICMMIDGLRYLADPEDRIACARLAVAYQKEILHRETDLNTILLNRVEDFLPEAFISQISTWRLMPLYELFEKLFLLFELKEIKEQDAYLCAFYDAVTEYLQNQSSELTAFLTYWDETMCSRTIPSGEMSGIKIMSIHKSKGLEFHTVLIPYCDWKMENETNNHLVWCPVPERYENLEPFNQLCLTPVNFSKNMNDSIYQDSYQEERLQLWVDNLNLLYVAFTRACKNLIVWAKSDTKGTVAELLQEALGQMAAPKMNLQTITVELSAENLQMEEQADTDEQADVPNTEIEVYEYGVIMPSGSRKKDSATSGNKLSQTSEDLPIYIESLETNIEFKQSNRSAAFIAGEEDEHSQDFYISRGQLLHYLFASVKTAEDLNQAVEKLKFEGIIETAEQEAEITRIARKALTQPQICKWFDGTWEVINECSIIYPLADGTVKTERPDRVMQKDGQVVVLDFKFGRKKAEYQQQVAGYMKLLREMGHKQVEGYVWYVYTNELDPVAEIC